MMRIFSPYGKFSFFFGKMIKFYCCYQQNRGKLFLLHPPSTPGRHDPFSSSVVVGRSTTRKTFLRCLSPRRSLPLNTVEHRHWRCWKILFFCHRACELEVGGTTRNHFHSVKLKSVKIIFYFLIMMSMKRERLLNSSTGWGGLKWGKVEKNKKTMGKFVVQSSWNWERELNKEQ